MSARSFQEFMQAVKESLDHHAQRKGYNQNGADGDNMLYDFCVSAGHEPGHTCGEITYKAAEYAKEPREVLALKIAAWAFLLWRRTPELRLRAGLDVQNVQVPLAIPANIQPNGHAKKALPECEPSSPPSMCS